MIINKRKIITKQILSAWAEAEISQYIMVKIKRPRPPYTRYSWAADGAAYMIVLKSSLKKRK